LKKISTLALLLLLLLITFVPSALAHSSLVTSFPQEGEVITENISTLLLTFNTTIENTSTFKITGESGQEIPLAEHVVKEKDMIGNLSSPLEDGKYIVTWKIIGDDGHPIGNSYSFSVITSKETVPEISKSTVATAKNNNTDNPNQDILYDKQNSNSNTIMVLSVVLLIVIALGTTFWLLKRGKN